ncbi:apolipoprotein N-acyltransferase [Microbacterium sp. 4R-513]|uniref:apolipoprotein N-acyltransferase n=1 Tax=Microbacterium sp. 4R-513 TaxID=2567934 RepID=UPI0013E1C9AE|nr:apolipoprotein N-acyltransferase [Microbacterium sp. 4R-513]QIG40762.1 apolipoprotein N-acyltransferase [Microbacterium sp. 4R-513]
MPDAPLAAAPSRPLLPLAIAAPASAAAGLVLTTAFPALAWWPMVFVAVPLALVCLVGRRTWSAFLVGFAFGAAFFFVNLSFTARYLGPVPWIALSMLEALLTAACAILIALAYRWVPRVLPNAWGRLVVLPVVVAGLWTLREEVLGTFPYGGFPWGRIGVTQSNGPLADVASWVGMSGLSFLVVLVCAAAIEYVRLGRWRDLRAAVPTVVALVLLIAPPQFATTDAGSIRVGAVQGNGPAGYFDQRGPNDILRAQVEATRPLIGEDMDVLLWPEGGIDSDPTQNEATAGVLDTLADRIGAPLLVSAVTQRGAEYFNSSLLWEDGADNPVDTYDKRHPVPFGEYVPDRWLYRNFAPDLIDLIQREYTPGTSSPMFDVNGVGVGLAICFDVIYDDVIWEGAQAGAEVYMFQTNNADFRGTDENLQQLAFARMRAIETGRSVVNLSTVGTSQVIAPDGTTIDGLPADEAGQMLTDVPLRTGLTPAVVLGPWVKALLAWGSVVALLGFGLAMAIRRRSAARSTTPPSAGTGAAHSTTPAPEGTGVVDV